MTVVISSGALVGARKSYPFATSAPLTRAATGGYIPLLRGEGLALSYEAMYRTQPWVYAVVNKLAYGGARLPLKAFMYEGDGDARVRARGTDLERLLKKPRPGVSSFEFKLDIWMSLLLHGHCLKLKVRESAGAPPYELWDVPWRLVQTIEDERGIIGYTITVGNDTIALAPSDVIHFELAGGVSPLEPLRRTLALEDAALTYQGNNFLNGVTPRGAFVSDQQISKDAAARVRDELAQMHAGVDNAGKFGVLGNGFKWAQMGASAVDAELINQRKLSREEVCGAYDVAPPLVGILDRATFNNVEELHKGLYVDSIGPKAQMIEEAMQAQLVDVEPAWDGYFVEHDMNAVLRPDTEARMRSYMMAQQSSTYSINERRKLENLPPIDDPLADTVLMPANMIPLGATADQGGDAAASMTEQLTMEAFAGGKPAGAEVEDQS